MADVKISDITVTATTFELDDLIETETASGTSQQTSGQLVRDQMLAGPGLPFSESIPLSDLVTAIVTGTTLNYWDLPFDAEDLEFDATLLVASSSGAPQFDVNKNAVTMLSTKLTIDATEVSSLTAATPAVVSVSTASRGDRLTFDIDTAGTGAMGVIITVRGRRA